MIPTLQLGGLGRGDAASAAGGLNYSPWDVSSLPSNVSASSGDYQLTKSGGGSSSRIVYHPASHASGKYDLRFLVRVPSGGAAGPAFGVVEVGESPGSYLGSTADAIGYWLNSVVTEEAVYRNGASAEIGNFGDGASFIEMMLALDFDNGRVYAGGNSTWGGSANPAAGTGFQVSMDTGKTYVLVADMYYDGDIVLLEPDDFTFPATSGFTAGWPD